MNNNQSLINQVLYGDGNGRNRGVKCQDSNIFEEEENYPQKPQEDNCMEVEEEIAERPINEYIERKENIPIIT